MSKRKRMHRVEPKKKKQLKVVLDPSKARDKDPFSNTEKHRRNDGPHRDKSKYRRKDKHKKQLISASELLSEISSIREMIAAPRPKDPTKLQNFVYDQKNLSIERGAVYGIVEAMKEMHSIMDPIKESLELEKFARAHQRRIEIDIEDGFEALKGLEYQLKRKHEEIFSALIAKLQKAGVSDVPNIKDIVFEGFNPDKKGEVNLSKITSSLRFKNKYYVVIEQTPQRKGYDILVGGVDMKNPTGALRELLSLEGLCGLPPDKNLIAKVTNSFREALDYDTRPKSWNPYSKGYLKIKGDTIEYKGANLPIAFHSNGGFSESWHPGLANAIGSYDFKKSRDINDKGQKTEVYTIKLKWSAGVDCGKLVSKLGSSKTPDKYQLERLIVSLEHARSRLRETKPSQAYQDLYDYFKPIMNHVRRELRALQPKKTRAPKTVAPTQVSPQRVVKKMQEKQEVVVKEDILSSLDAWISLADNKYYGDGTYGRQAEALRGGKVFSASVRGIGEWGPSEEQEWAWEEDEDDIPDPDWYEMYDDSYLKIDRHFNTFMKSQSWWDSSKYSLEFDNGEKEWSYFTVRMK